MRRRGALWKVTTRDARDVVVTIHVEALDERAYDSSQAEADDAT
jgi:hypothetical protein